MYSTLSSKPYDYWVNKIELTKTNVTSKKEIIHPNVDVSFLSFLVGVIDGDGYPSNSYDLREKFVQVTDATYNIDPHFITGFTDAEGCFAIGIFKKDSSKLGWYVTPLFQITLRACFANPSGKPEVSKRLNIIKTD